MGTTYSAIGHVSDGKPVILANGSERLVPSVVGFTPDDELVVGTPARNQLALYPDRTVASIKRKMGAEETTPLNGRQYTPAEVSAIILRELKRVAEDNLGREVSRAVITVPAYFADAARQATKDAGEIAGLTVERILNEPTAAALAYGLDRTEDQQLVAVYDLGGGTFDVSLIELNLGVVEVRASHGDPHLGGDDFDAKLVELLADQFEQEHETDVHDDLKAMARLRRAAEEAKIALSTRPFAQVKEEYLAEKGGKPLHLETEVSRSEFEALIEDLLAGTLTAFDKALVDAELTAKDLDRVLFVGGSTRIPRVWELVANHVGLEPMTEINPDEAVALGAGVQAALIAGEPLDAILVDVTPHSLGIDVMRWSFRGPEVDRFARLIHRNTVLPVSHAEVFTTARPDQEAVDIKVYQGESDTASDNTLLGEFRFEDLEPIGPGDFPEVTVQFDLDLNGILHVSTVDRGSGGSHEATMEAARGRMDVADKETAAQHVASLSEAVVDVADEADALLTRAHALLGASETHKAALAQQYERLAEIADGLEQARDGDDAEGAESLEDELLDLLYELEDEPALGGD